MDHPIADTINSVSQNVVVATVMISVAFLIFTTVRRILIARHQSGVQMRLIDKIEPGAGLTEWSATETGQAFLATLPLEKDLPRSPYRNILFSVQAGIVLLMLGLAILLLRAAHAVEAPALVIGAVPAALGIGFLLAGLATYALSQKLGLLPRANRD